MSLRCNKAAPPFFNSARNRSWSVLGSPNAGERRPIIQRRCNATSRVLLTLRRLLRCRRTRSGHCQLAYKIKGGTVLVLRLVLALMTAAPLGALAAAQPASPAKDEQPAAPAPNAESSEPAQVDGLRSAH